jgi:hypothetical protein
MNQYFTVEILYYHKTHNTKLEWSELYHRKTKTKKKHKEKVVEMKVTVIVVYKLL